MTLMEPYAFYDPRGVLWSAPAGSEIDGASIPQKAWSLIGGPYEGLYRFASVIHDVACDERKRPWEEVHVAFYYGMRASGVDEIKAKVMFAAVYEFGPRWPRYVHVPGTSLEQAKQSAAAMLNSLLPGEALGDAVAVMTPSSPFSPQLPGPLMRLDGLGREVPLDRTVAIAPYVVVQEIRPPRQTMTDHEFDELRKLIEEKNISIEEITRAGRRPASLRPFGYEVPRPPREDDLPQPLPRPEFKSPDLPPGR